MNFINKIINILVDILNLLASIRLNSLERGYRRYFKNLSHERLTTKNILLLPLQNDFAAMKISFLLANELNSNYNFKIKFFFVGTPVDTFSMYQNNNELRKLYYYFKHKLDLIKIVRIFSLKKYDIIASNFNNFSAIHQVKFKDKEALLQFRYKEILIGDLIYDHYLRFYSRPTVYLDDLRFLQLVHYSINLLEYWISLLSKITVKVICIPYTSYLNWGIISRVGLYLGVDIINYGSPLYMFQKLDSNHIYHTKNFKLYKKYWNKLDNKEERLRLAESSLNQRLNGGISDIAYMKKSSFLRTSSYKISSSTAKNVVIFLHCFFDSPHIYGGGLFVDFYEWLEYLLDFAAKDTSTSYFVKPHPNGVTGNEEVVESFKFKYSDYRNIIFLDVEVSNLDIQDLSPDLIITFYGTVAQEFSYLGFPVVLCGDSPMKYYSFTYQPVTLKELDDLLLKVGEYKLPNSYDKEEILEFYYMHYMYYSHDVDSTKFQFSKNFTTGDLSITEYDNINSLIY